ncbi:MAG: class I SAM-dependent methyltransferase [Candidatus Magasanikbacteria bacterium]|nr:class I SAM-dependent methyltransferase [Candidatus Magasanikbacteria bacterium]
MSFNYEQSIWGRGEASLRWSDPTAFRLKQSLQAIASLPAGAKVLEVGCGAGQFIRAIKKMRPEFECFGSDISREAITLAQQKNDGVEYFISEPYKLIDETSPFVPLLGGEGNFDAVLVFDVLEHVDNPAALLQEIRRVLKPNGIFYAFVPCEGDWLSLWHLLEVLHLKKDLTKKHAGHIQYFSRRSLLKLFGQNYFLIQRLRYSEHLLGQKIGILAFWLMERATKKQGGKQINNETYFGEQGSGLIRLIKKLVNGLVYIESTLFSLVPSPNVHVVAKKLATPHPPSLSRG